MANRDTSVAQLAAELGVKPVTIIDTSAQTETSGKAENASSPLGVSFCTQS